MLDIGDLGQFLVLATILGYQPGGGGGGGVTYPIALNKGGTNTVLTATPNALVVGTASGMAFLATVNSGVLTTNASGVPSVSTTLPSGLTIPGFLPTPTSLGTNRLVMGNSTTTMIGIVTPNSSVLGSSGTGVPTWSTTLPSGLTVPGYPKTTSFAGNPNGNVAGNAGDFVIDTASANELWFCATSGTSTTATWTLAAGAGGSGVTSVTAGTGLSGGTITSTGTIALASQAASTLLGNPLATVGIPSAITIGANLALSTSGVLSATFPNPLPVAQGGTGSNLSAAAGGGIPFVTPGGGSLSILGVSGVVTNQVLLSGMGSGTGGAQTPRWTNYTIPASLTGNMLLWSSTSGTVAELTSAANEILLTNGSNVPGFASALPASFVTYASIQNVTAAKLLGNPTGSAAAPSEITIGTGLTLTGSTLSATGAPITFPITLAQGGTNADLSAAANGAIPYVDSSAMVALAPASIAFSVLQADGSSFPIWTPYSFPQTLNNVGGIIYIDSTSSLSQTIPSSANQIFITNGSNVPEWASSLPSGFLDFSQFPTMGGNTLIANATGSTAVPTAVSVAGALTLTGGVLTNTSPTATGGGASGTWGISISGNAATASSASTASLASAVSAGAITTASLATGAVTYAKIQNVTAARLLGNPTGSAAAPSEISLGTGLSFTGSVLNATGGSSLPSTTTANLMLQSTTTGGTVAWGSTTWPLTVPVGGVLYASAANTITSTVPTISNQILLANGSLIPQWGNNITGLTLGFLTIGAPLYEGSAGITTPTSGSTFTLTNTSYSNYLTPAAPLAALTIALPATPTANIRQRISTTQPIAALTVSTTGTATIFNAPTSLFAGQSFEMWYSSTNNAWYPHTNIGTITGRLLKITILRTAGTTVFTPQANTANAIVYALAGGQPGGGVSGGAGTVGGGGGAAGSYAALQLTLAQMIGSGTTMQIVVGAAAAATTLTNNGGAGTQIVTCPAGGAGTSGSNSTTLQVTQGGTVSALPTVGLGTILELMAGEGGGCGLGSGGNIAGFGGNGGSSRFGYGGQQVAGANNAGFAATGNGSGGGGAFSSSSALGGGAGAPGYCAIYEFS